jgi:hypothetical protein
MAIDDMPKREGPSSPNHGTSSGNQKIIALVVILLALAIGEIYSFSQMASMRDSFASQEAQTRKELKSEISNKLLAVEQSNEQQLEAVKTELDQAGKRLGTQNRELRSARATVAKIETEKNQQINNLKQAIALKADQEQVAALNQDVSSTKSDLDVTKKNVDTLANDYGMTKSKYGTLIARNHGEIVELRKLGQRNYYEFTITRHKPARVATVDLTLKKTNVKHHQFTVVMLVNDMQIEKKNRTIDEPIFFSMPGSHAFDELVVNRVDKEKITGYISTPKNAELASRSEGTD